MRARRSPISSSPRRRSRRTRAATMWSCIISRRNSPTRSTRWCFPAMRCSTAARCGAAFQRHGSCTSGATRCSRCATASARRPRTTPRWKTLAGPSSSSPPTPRPSASAPRTTPCWAIPPAGRSRGCSAARSWATGTTMCPSPVCCCWSTPSTTFMRQNRSTTCCWIPTATAAAITIRTSPTA